MKINDLQNQAHAMAEEILDYQEYKEKFEKQGFIPMTFADWKKALENDKQLTKGNDSLEVA